MHLVNIMPIQVSPRKIFLTVKDLTEFALEPGTSIQIKAGSSVTDAVIASSQDGSHISTGLLEALGLPATGMLNVKKDGPGSLRIGPLIGIIVSRGKKHKLPPYTSQNRHLRSYLNISAGSGCLAYVFFPAGVDTETQTVTGYYLGTNPDGLQTWLKHTFPLPDVVYDRILFRSVEKKQQTKKITSYFLNHERVKYFNPKFLNKWETYSILSRNQLFRKHLPETKIYRGPESLIKFSESHKTVYVKPINGSLGKGIMKISHTSEGYVYQYRVGKQPVSGIWQDVSELTAGLKAFLCSPPYIMQQGLELLKYRDRVFDIRVLMQKDGQGRWINSATVARVGLAGSIFPNVAAGGEAVDICQVWQEIKHADWFSSATYTLTKQISQAAGEDLEKALGTFGEIGLDIGVDLNGNIWLIEINSKPSRKVIPKEQPHLKNLSLKLPIDFAKYVAGFGQAQERDQH